MPRNPAAIPSIRNDADAYAIQTAHDALTAALAALAVAYDAVEDARIESLLSSLTSAIEEGQGDLNVLAYQIHDDEAEARANTSTRWFRPYAAA